LSKPGERRETGSTTSSATLEGVPQRADLLRFQVEEIDTAGLRAGEEEELTNERAVLANAERLAVDAATAYGSSPVGTTMWAPVNSRANRRFEAPGSFCPTSAGSTKASRPVADRLAEIGFLLEDVAVRFGRIGTRSRPTRHVSSPSKSGSAS
jgi:hypothetical protein